MPNPIEACCLAELDGIRHGFFTRAGGVSGGCYASLNCGLGSQDQTALVVENRARVARHLGGLRPEVLTLYQVHGATARFVDHLIPREMLPKADAVVTRTPGLVVGVLTADCAPVLLADARARVVAAAHAGWRGALAGIIEAALDAMEEAGARRDRIRAAVGPCIGRHAYEVGPEFEAEVREKDAESSPFFVDARSGARAHFNLAAYAAHRLERAGAGAIELLSPCTYENESDFFSYRRAQHLGQADYGRQISAIVLA